jgi:hypothetical protein
MWCSLLVEINTAVFPRCRCICSSDKQVRFIRSLRCLYQVIINTDMTYISTCPFRIWSRQAACRVHCLFVMLCQCFKHFIIEVKVSRSRTLATSLLRTTLKFNNAGTKRVSFVFSVPFQSILAFRKGNCAKTYINKKFSEDLMPPFLWYDLNLIENKHPQFPYCCECIRCRDNVFTEPFPSNDRVADTDWSTSMWWVHVPCFTYEVS